MYHNHSSAASSLASGDGASTIQDKFQQALTESNLDKIKELLQNEGVVLSGESYGNAGNALHFGLNAMLERKIEEKEFVPQIFEFLDLMQDHIDLNIVGCNNMKTMHFLVQLMFRLSLAELQEFNFQKINEYKIEINHQDSDGNTPLHCWSYNMIGCFDKNQNEWEKGEHILTELLELGAKPLSNNSEVNFFELFRDGLNSFGLSQSDRNKITESFDKIEMKYYQDRAKGYLLENGMGFIVSSSLDGKKDEENLSMQPCFDSNEERDSLAEEEVEGDFHGEERPEGDSGDEEVSSAGSDSDFFVYAH